MKLAILTLAFAVLAHGANSRRSQIPECALECMDYTVSTETKCDTDDFDCICKSSDAVQKAGRDCVMDKCGFLTALSMTVSSTREGYC